MMDPLRLSDCESDRRRVKLQGEAIGRDARESDAGNGTVSRPSANGFPMTDPFPWSIHLGRWSGTRIRISFLLAIFVAAQLIESLLSPRDHPLGATGGWLAMLLAAIALHELGHVAAATRFGFDIDEIRLWPLGGLASPSAGFGARPIEAFWVALAGPLANLVGAFAAGLALTFTHARMVLNPFGHHLTGGTPLIDGKAVAAFAPSWWIGWFGYLNVVLFLANLIPALPMDGGRMLRAFLAGPSFALSREHMIAPLFAYASAIILGVAGIYRCFAGRPEVGWILIALAIFIWMTVRLEARGIDDGGFFDDGVFGYDFSEGYTSLEGDRAEARPLEEGVLNRWRRRRRELRRQRRLEREAAEERRMDEILAKLHRDGRSALTVEEQRFLIRVSSKYKNKQRNHP